MSVDKFGRSLYNSKLSADMSVWKPPGQLLYRTSEGDVDMEHHALRNVKEPSENSDCATKHFVDLAIENINNEIKKQEEFVKTQIVGNWKKLRGQVEELRKKIANLEILFEVNKKRKIAPSTTVSVDHRPTNN